MRSSSFFVARTMSTRPSCRSTTTPGPSGHGSGGATTLKVYAAWVDEADKRAATTMAGIMPTPVASTALRGPDEVIAASLRDQIASGELRPGDELPTIIELAAAHTVATGTAYRAMALLKEECLVAVKRGRRATVADSPTRTSRGHVDLHHNGCRDPAKEVRESSRRALSVDQHGSPGDLG